MILYTTIAIAFILAIASGSGNAASGVGAVAEAIAAMKIRLIILLLNPLIRSLVIIFLSILIRYLTGHLMVHAEENALREITDNLHRSPRFSKYNGPDSHISWDEYRPDTMILRRNHEAYHAIIGIDGPHFGLGEAAAAAINVSPDLITFTETLTQYIPAANMTTEGAINIGKSMDFYQNNPSMLSMETLANLYPQLTTNVQRLAAINYMTTLLAHFWLVEAHELMPTADTITSTFDHAEQFIVSHLRTIENNVIPDVYNAPAP